MKNEEMLNIEYVDIDKVFMYENNAKEHTEEQINDIVSSIKKYGMNDPIAVWKDNVIIEGHGRLIACKQLGFNQVPIIRLENLSDQERREYMLVHNQTTMETGWDFSKLEQELADLDFSDFSFDFEKVVTSEQGDSVQDTEEHGSLAEKFLIPPFSVLYGNKGEWLKRKKDWIKKGIKSEIGRGGELVFQLPGWMERQSRLTRGI